MILALALVSVSLAALPAVLAVVNLLALRSQTTSGRREPLSLQAEGSHSHEGDKVRPDLSSPRPHPEVAERSGALEGELQKPLRSLEPSFEAADAAPQDEGNGRDARQTGSSNTLSACHVSILIPARDEAATIVGTVRAALATTGVTLEVLVGDDHSTDATASLVQGIAATDPRVRLVAVPPLPEGWTGKNHACSVLGAAARGPHLLFIDADVTLAPGGAASLVAHAVATGSALVSAVPRQRMATLGERLTVPMIGFLLVGYLPIPMMRASLRPSLGAACGQLVLVDRAVYAATGGHGAIRAFLHDGVLLARLFRRAGHRTDLVAGAGLATCRMYRSWREAWAGFSKNAHEGMATPRALPVWTALLFGGHILPVVILALFGLRLAGPLATGLAGLALLLSLGSRAAITLAMREPWTTIPLHPLTVAVALAIQWNVLLRRKTAGAAVWKGRSYPLNGA